MAFLGLMLRTGLRHRSRSWLALALLAAVAIGMVLAGAQTARRTQTAFPRYEAAHGYDELFHSAQPVPRVASLPGVASATTSRSSAATLAPDAGRSAGTRTFRVVGTTVLPPTAPTPGRSGTARSSPCVP